MEENQHYSPIKMDGFHLSTHKCMSGYYSSNPIYKANIHYCAVQKPREKRKKKKQSLMLMYIKMLNSRTNQSLWCVCLHSWDINSILAKMQVQYIVSRNGSHGADVGNACDVY